MNDMSDIPQDLLTQSIAGRRLDNKCIILTTDFDGFDSNRVDDTVLGTRAVDDE